jgi:hypothetical protein
MEGREERKKERKRKLEKERMARRKTLQIDHDTLFQIIIH